VIRPVVDGLASGGLDGGHHPEPAAEGPDRLTLLRVQPPFDRLTVESDLEGELSRSPGCRHEASFAIAPAQGNRDDPDT